MAAQSGIAHQDVDAAKLLLGVGGQTRRHGRVGHVGMRFYHAMFQLFIFAMLLCLLTNNVGILWIAMELATLSTVLLVSLYRTPTAIEAVCGFLLGNTAAIALAINGSGYYTTPLELRPFRTDYAAMKPSGVFSHGLGIVGSLMIVLGMAAALFLISLFLGSRSGETAAPATTS